MECIFLIGHKVSMKTDKTEKPANHIKEWRKYRKMTQEALADAVGVVTASISQIETGKQGFTDTTLYAIADALQCSAGDLLTKAPPSTDDDAATYSFVALMGHVGAGAEVEEDFEQVPEGGLEQIEVPFPLPADMIAFEVRGDSMLPMYDPGSVLIVYAEQRKPVESFFGQRVIVRTNDGRRFIKTLMKGEGPLVSLLSWNASPIQNVHVTWIGEIFTVFPAEQVRRAARQIHRQGGIQGQLRLKNG
jgi:phage repressor protein C with HTH and peptisase S24 domain